MDHIGIDASKVYSLGGGLHGEVHVPDVALGLAGGG